MKDSDVCICGYGDEVTKKQVRERERGEKGLGFKQRNQQELLTKRQKR